jgi:hypothetical protein
MTPLSPGLGPCAWLARYCPSLDGQYLFLDPLRWETHLLSEGAVVVLTQAAKAIEMGEFDAFVADVVDAGGWPPGLEFLARSLLVLRDAQHATA